MENIFIIAHTIIIATALWAIFSPRVNDGFVGKLTLAFMCFASVACIGWAVEIPNSVDQSDMVFSLSVAVMAVRCYWMKHYAVQFRRWIRRIRQEF